MSRIADIPFDRLQAAHPCVGEFVTSLGISIQPDSAATGDWVSRLPDEIINDAGLERHQILSHLEQLVQEAEESKACSCTTVDRLTLIGGRDKSGKPEKVRLELHSGDIVCVVGPTGSGKSRLLSDIECLAQGDTPSKRKILIDGAEPTKHCRQSSERKLVTQLSQNMNFVTDLSVCEFIRMHAECRQIDFPEKITNEVIDCANKLTGEKFSPDASVTQLSGGQTRALMIADAALLSVSPIILIDEIENAGVDRKKAMELLVSGKKIAVISTHDPLLALRCSRRIVIRNGGIAEVLATNDAERHTLACIETSDAKLMNIRERLRQGQRIESGFHWPG